MTTPAHPGRTLFVNLPVADVEGDLLQGRLTPEGLGHPADVQDLSFFAGGLRHLPFQIASYSPMNAVDPV